MNLEYVRGKKYSATIKTFCYLGGIRKVGDVINFTITSIHPQRYETGLKGFNVMLEDYPNEVTIFDDFYIRNVVEL